MNRGIVRTGLNNTPNSPCAGANTGRSAGLMARLFLFELVRKHATGNSLVRRHTTYREPLACERYEPTMIHRRFALEFEHAPALRVDIE
jgi:hypothetical protein